MPAESNTNPFAGYDIAVNIKECIEPYLAGTTEGLPNRSCVTSGDIAWDDCECGQLIVSMQTAYESDNFPSEAAISEFPGRRSCGPSIFVFTYLVSMLRCAPTFGPSGEPPTCSKLDTAARIAAEDAWAVRAGVVCCLTEAVKERQADGTKLYVDFTMGTQTFVGPDGLCQGSTLPVTVGIQNGCYPCDIS